MICIPVKPLARAKSRLAPLLTPGDRRRLVLAMLADVLEAVRAVGDPGGCVVVGSDADVAAVAERTGASFLADPGRGLNAALRYVAAAALASGAPRLLVLPGDVPAASPSDVARLLTEDVDAVIVPAHDGDGTGALLLRPPDTIGFHFGPGSCRAHVEEAVARNRTWRLLPLPSLAQDVDRPEDLLGLGTAGLHTERFLVDIRAARR